MDQKRASDDAAADPARQQPMMQALAAQLDPWQQAVEQPAPAQAQVLARFLADYARTDYGAGHGAASVTEAAAASGAARPREGDSGSALVEAYRRAFPVMTYADYKPLIASVLAGDTKALLCEEPLGWAITRGTTADEPKFIPMTLTDIKMRVSAGRAMMAYVAATKRLDLFAGVNLNLNFPSVVGTVKVGDRQIEYGYSSGIYTKFVSKSTPIRSVPSQEDIDALGGGTSRAAWDARFELALEQCRDQNVTLVGGVCQTARGVRALSQQAAQGLSQAAVEDAGDDPGQHARHQHPPCGPTHRHVRTGGDTRDLRGHRGHVRPAARRPPRLGAQLRPLLLRGAHPLAASRCCTRCGPARSAVWWCPPPSWPATALAT